MKICFKNTAKPYQNQKKLKYELVYYTYNIQARTKRHKDNLVRSTKLEQSENKRRVKTPNGNVWNVNQKSLARSLLAVAAAAEYLLKIGHWSAAAFLVKKQRRCRLSRVTKKSSGAAATTIEKVVALVAPLCPSLWVSMWQARCQVSVTSDVNKKTKLVFLKKRFFCLFFWFKKNIVFLFFVLFLIVIFK